MAARSGPAGDPGGASAEDVAAAVRVHADRVHDVVRRLGCPPAVAVEVVETSALDLVDALADRPEAVADPVGEWFGRAREAAAQRATGSPDLPLGGGLLAGDEEQEALAAALDRLPEKERFAVLLRDSYDLPATAVGAALGTDPDSALDVVGRGRLALLPLLDEPAPAVPGHLTDLAALARIGEAGPVAARDATARRHALSCPDCRAVTDAQQRAHLLLTALAVAALPEADRAGVLSRVGAAASAALPASTARRRPQEAAYRSTEVPGPAGPSLSPLAVVLSVALAALLGLGIGVLLVRTAADDPAGEGTAPSDALLISPQPTPTAVQVSPPTLTFPQPRTTVFTVAPSPPPPSPTPTREPLGVALEPSAGPNGAPLTVRGTGWTPDAQVELAYVDPLGRPTGAKATATVDAQGRFTAELIALDPAALPGEHVVQARHGEVVVEAAYDVQP